MRISVIIPTRNRADRLKAVLDAVMSDPYHDKEVIVCDGASTDGTVDLLRAYGDQVRWVSEKDGGEFQARNKAVAMSTGAIIRNLSDDDVPVPGSLGAAAEWFARYPETDILFGQSINYYVTRSGEVFTNDTRKRTSRSITIRNFISGHALFPVSETVFFRKSVVERIGRFDTVMGGDYEYWARAAYNKLNLRISDSVFVHHYRYEHGEDVMAPIYRNLIAAHMMVARRYGSLWDKLYMSLIRIPFLRAKHDLGRLLPANLARRLRTVLWSRRNAVPTS